MMKTYIDVLIDSKYEDPGDFILAMKTFGNNTNGWEFLDHQSKEYATALGEPSCALLRTENKYSPAVAITVKKNNTFYIANIVPKLIGNMSMDEYNDVAKQFFIDFKQYVTIHKLKLKIRMTHEYIDLPEIIKGTKTRELFERYLNLFPTSYHPCDIERLDIFICAVFRYSRHSLDLDLLRNWLITKKQWSEKDAFWCVTRIETGLEVLKANKKF